MTDPITYDDEEDEIIEDYGPHVDEVIRLIPDDASKDSIEKELRENVDYYCLKIDQAKRRVVRLHGGDVKKLIGDLIFTDLINANGPNRKYNVRAMVLETRFDEYQSKDGLNIKTVVMVTDFTKETYVVLWGMKELSRGSFYIFKYCKYESEYNNLSTSASNVIDVPPQTTRESPVTNGDATGGVGQ